VKQIDKIRNNWARVMVVNRERQSDRKGAGCVAQTKLTKEEGKATFIELSCAAHQGGQPTTDMDCTDPLYRGNYVKTDKGYFPIFPSMTE
jgi:hypothetical protein